MIVTRSPETRAKKVDSERLTVRRLDLVDEKGVIRMTLAAPTPEPIVDGIQYRRIFPASGMVSSSGTGTSEAGTWWPSWTAARTSWRRAIT